MKQRNYEAGVRVLTGRGDAPTSGWKPKALRPTALARLAAENDELRERQKRARAQREQRARE